MGLEVRHIDQWSHFIFADREGRGELCGIFGREWRRLRAACNQTKGRHGVDFDAVTRPSHQDLSRAPLQIRLADYPIDKAGTITARLRAGVGRYPTYDVRKPGMWADVGGVADNLFDVAGLFILAWSHGLASHCPKFQSSVIRGSGWLYKGT